MNTHQKSKRGSSLRGHSSTQVLQRQFLQRLSHHSRAWIWCVALLLLVMAPATVVAHGAGYESVERDAVAIRFAYVLGEPMTGAEVRVYPPGEESPWQVARADRQGRFAFVPDRPGVWRVVGDDGAGHRVRAEVNVTASGAELEAPGIVRIPPAWLLGGLLVSILLNAGLLSALIAARRRRTKA